MKRLHVLPVLGGWTVREMGDWQAFWYDLWHYGPLVALWNAGCALGIWHPAKE